ncbi:hypothetical protein [Thermocrinis minervae]|uniref:Predicted nucleic-acid-binding protein, contains PIN domain n=1 Tax=Thermocrinis minervae TaxID=381751 RepID=A0A1M6SEQ4_9AQUI|nr:hypothetical protein [Thermocrinis minervae]SHK43190.1 Predicted nucleic-acid-binding protein, contains PIN domain [Thermocrinis minervae]
MKAITFRTLLEFLAGSERAQKVEEELRKLERSKQKVYVSNYTILELVYYLQEVLGLPKEKVVDIVRTILEDRLFKVEEKNSLERALKLYLEGYDFLEALKKVQYEENKIGSLL